MHNGVLRVDLSDHETVADTTGSHRRQVSKSIPRRKTQATSVHTHPPEPHVRTLSRSIRKRIKHGKTIAQAIQAPEHHDSLAHPVERRESHVVASDASHGPVKAVHHMPTDLVSSFAAPGRISSRARTLLLAHIGYPRPARRRGWKGLGTFQLLIVHEGVRKVTMLASTGHGLLDQAAVRGLMAAGRIPLLDGIYDLPVEFRLQ